MSQPPFSVEESDLFPVPGRYFNVHSMQFVTKDRVTSLNDLLHSVYKEISGANVC